MRLPPPDPLTTILLYLSAIQMALNAALAPETAVAKAYPVLTLSGMWPYVPILLLSVATVIWVVRSWARSGPNSHNSVHMGAIQLPVVIETPPPQMIQQAPPREPWHAKLDGFQIYLLVYMGMFFLYQITQVIFGHK